MTACMRVCVCASVSAAYRDFDVGFSSPVVCVLLLLTIFFVFYFIAAPNMANFIDKFALSCGTRLRVVAAHHFASICRRRRLSDAMMCDDNR